MPGKEDEEDAGNQHQYATSFSPGEVEELLKGVPHDGLFQESQLVDEDERDAYRSDEFQDEYQ